MIDSGKNKTGIKVTKLNTHLTIFDLRAVHAVCEQYPPEFCDAVRVRAVVVLVVGQGSEQVELDL
jgi:hypothetical protein